MLARRLRLYSLIVFSILSGLVFSGLGQAAETIWVEDAVPSGAILAGTSESWNFISSNPTPFSGSLAHQSALVAGTHQHYFFNATDKLSIGVGETLFVYVYLDPSNPPSEVMLQWHGPNNDWEHRAYWGTNSIRFGGVDGTASLRYMGPMPAAGEWVRLEVPASAVGLEGVTIDGMAFSLFDGRATWDRAGKAASAPVNIVPIVSITAPANNSAYTAPATITLDASATDSDGINRVEFYNGAALLNSDTTAPYSYTWGGVTAGSYTLTAKAYDNLGASTTSLPISVTVIVSAPTVSLSAAPATISSGASSTLNWSSANATTCTASGAWSGSKPVNGSELLVNITATSTFTLTCTGSGGSTSQSTTVTVTPSGGSSTLSGMVDSSLIANLQQNAIYIYAGNVVPDDVGGTGAQPLKIVPVVQDNGACGWRYNAGSLADGQYTLAFTNQAANDNPATNDAIAFQRVVLMDVSGGAVSYNFAPARVLAVGPGKTYPNVLAAAAAVQNGDVIEIDAGQYDDNIVVWRANDLTLRGVGGRAHMHATQEIAYTPGNDLQNGKGLWVTLGANIKVENIEFSNASVADKNGAGIRAEGANLAICNSYFHDNENGILGGAGQVLIEYSEFAHNGGCPAGFGCAHNLYITNTDKLVFRHNYSHDANIGHLLKSRAKENHILYNRLTGESGTSSYEVDIPDGGLTYLVGNLIQQGPQTDNSTMVAYAAESASNPVQQLYAVNNTLVNENGTGTAISIRAGSTAQVINNLFVGNGTTVSGPATQTSNLASNSPNFVNQAAYDYRLTGSSPGINSGSAPGASSAGFVLTPVFQYLHPLNREARAVNGALDIGAYEYTGLTPQPTVSFSANPIAVSSGSSSTLTWSSTNATSCTASGAWSGSKANSGSESTGALSASSTFTLTCSGNGGSTSQSVTVTISNTPPPSATPAFVRIATNTVGAASSVSTTLSGVSGTGNLMVVALTYDQQSVSVSAVTDSKGNTYTRAAGPTNWSGTRYRSEMYYAKNINGGGAPISISATLTGLSTSFIELYAAEYSGVSADPLDQSAVATGNSVNTDSGARTTTHPTELIVGHGESYSGSMGAGVGFTARSTVNSNMFEDKVVSSAGDYSASSTNANSDWVQFMLTFRAADGGAAPVPTVSLSANPASVASGGTSTISWTASNATSCTASGAWSGSRATAGAESTSALTTTSTYTLTCTGAGGSASQSVTVSVTQGTPVPTVTLAANPANVTSGGSSTLAWTSTNASSCTASGAWSGSKATSGNQSSGALSVTSTYTLTCSGTGGSAAQSVTVTVLSGGGFVPLYPLPAPGQAIALGTHTAQEIRPAEYYDGAWQYSLFDSYGGGVFVPSFSKAGAYAIAGSGGHKSNEYTGGVVFDFETGTWQLLPDASGTPAHADPFFVADTNGAPEFEIALASTTPNAVPAPPHPYMNLMPLPPELGGGPLGSLVYAIQAAQCAESVTSTRAHRFDLATRTWSRYTSNHLNGLGGGLSVSHDAPSVYDPTAKRIWQLPNQIHSTQSIGYIDLTEASPQWRLSTSWNYPPTWDGTDSAWLDDTRRLILMQSPTRLIALDLNNLAAGPRELSFSGTLPPYGNRWAFYPPDGSFYNKSNTGNVIWKLTPPSGDPLTGTWAITSFTVTGATLPDISDGAQLYGARHFTRFFYVPAIASFAWIADSHSPVMLIRPPSSGPSAPPPLPTVNISASPSSIPSGSATTLAWYSTDATSCAASGAWSGARATAGAELLSALNVTSTYTLTCTGPGGSTAQSTTVSVTSGPAAPTVSLSANPASVASGGSSTLTWSSANATSCSASGAWSGSRAVSGSEATGALSTTSTYTLACTGAGGSASQSTIVSVGAPPPVGLVTSLNMVNSSGGNQTNAPVTFGHAFKQGDVPAGFTLIAKDSGGNSVTLQVDKKATHSDGSLRHAILTAKLPTLGVGATQTLNLYTQADGAQGTPISIASLLATAFDAQVSLNVGGTVYSASARALLQTTTPKTWLAGPEVSEWIVGAPVKTAGGVAHPHLTAYFHIRAYAGSPITRVRVDTVVENNWTLVPNPSDFTYLPNVTIGGATIYNNGGANLTHYQHARWHQVGWWNNTDSKIYAQLDVNYLQDTKAIPKYETLTPTEAFLNSVRQSTPPMDNGDQEDYMPSGGASDGIGPLPRWDAVYAVSGDQRAFNYMLANADGGAAYSSHFRDEITKLPVTIDSYPNASLWDPSGSSPAIPEGPSANPYVYDGAHQPSIGYTAYLLTGDYFYLEEMQFWSANNLIATGSYARGGSIDYVAAKSTNGSTGIWYTGSLRGQAWAYRSLLQAASITPDTHALKNYFTTKLNNNLAYDTWQYVDANSAESNGLGMMYQAGRNDPSSSIYGEYRMWFDNFISWAYQYAVDLGYSNAIPMRDYKAKTAIGMMGLAANESCFQFAPRYISRVGPLSPSPIYFSTFKEVYEATVPGASAHICGSKDMANYLTGIEGYTYVINQMTGGQSATDYYFAVWQPALAAAADSGLAGGATAWSRSLLSGIHPDYRDQPIWAIVPRGN